MVNHELSRWADDTEADLRAIRQLLRKGITADLGRANLTAPQLGLVMALTAENGQSLTALSERLHLSHSTVSGIVDRLARKGLVERRIDPDDRRFSRVYLTAPVLDYTQRILPARAQGGLLRAAWSATPEERAAIRSALTTLRRLLEGDSGDGAR